MSIGTRTEILRDAAAFVRHWDAIHSLRSSLSAQSDVLLDPIHFLAATDDTRRSCSVAVWRDGQMIGLVYATQHFMKGIATGYAIGGDFTGRGLLLCAAADENLVLQEAVRRSTSEGIHALHLRFLPKGEPLATIKGLRMKTFDAVIPGDLLHLPSDYEVFLGKLGKNTRRNIRACVRKIEQERITFAPSLSKFEYDSAIARLNAETDFPADPLRLARDERLLLLHKGERMGLRSADGTIIAVLCGFRKAGRFYLLTQLNDANFERLSLSLVLRSCIARFLIGGGVTSLHFMGGSSLTFGRYCQPESYRSIFIDRRVGLAAVLKELASAFVKCMQAFGKTVPEALAALCSGHLEDSMLTERTVLLPAAMLNSQRQSSIAGAQSSPTNGDVNANSSLLRGRASV